MKKSSIFMCIFLIVSITVANAQNRFGILHGSGQWVDMGIHANPNLNVRADYFTTFDELKINGKGLGFKPDAWVSIPDEQAGTDCLA